MGLNEQEVSKQLDHMMRFIEQEANEKAEEIEAKAEEEFNIEKSRLVQQQRQKIMDFYDRKEKQVELQKKIQHSNMINQARLKILKAREDHVKNVLDEARNRLVEISNNPTQYRNILKGLIIQALFRLLEPEVVLRCREKDLQMIKEIMPECLKELKEKSKAQCKLTIDKTFLNPDLSGGVELLCRGGKIKVVSTLESRLDLISSKMTPDIRNALFGTNQNRKFMD